MPAFISLQDAAHHYSLSESTLHKWLDKHWLTSHKVLVRGHSHYLIEVEELEKLLDERGMTGRTSASQDGIDLTTQLQALEQRVSELEDRVRSLEAFQHEIHTLPATPIPQPQNKPLRIHHANPDKENNPLPDGYVSFFAFQHGIPDTSAGRWKREQPSTLVQEGAWHGASGHQVKIALTPDGQRAYYLWAKDRPGFTTCDLCPHVPKLD